MPTGSESVQIVVGSLVHVDWDSYEVDSDLLVPADAWHVTLSMMERTLPESIKPGTPLEIRVGDNKVMVGRIDRVSQSVSSRARRVRISGRDGAAILLDCSSPIFTAQMVSLEDVIAKAVRPLGVNSIRIDAAASQVREKISVNPGETAWQVLTNAAEANGLWPWFEPDGTLVIGGPNYDKPPVATLTIRYDGQGNNTLSLDHDTSIHGRYSQVTVLGQTPGTYQEEGRHNISQVAYDEGVTWYRPKVVVDHEADSNRIALNRARKLLTDSRLNALTINAVVAGHRIVAPGEPDHGLLWTPGQRVRIVSEPHQIDDVFFLMARRFSGGRNEGARTRLILKEDRTWVLDAHPHKRKYRCRKTSSDLEIIDASKGAGA